MCCPTMMEFRLTPRAVKWFALLWLFQIWIGNIGIVTGRHIKLHGTVSEDRESVIVEAPTESQDSSFRRSLVRKNEYHQNQHNQNQYYSSSSSSPSLSGLTSPTFQMQMHLKEPGSSSRQHNFFGDDENDRQEEDGILEEDHHSYHERYIGNGGNQGNQAEDQEQKQGNYETTDDDEAELGRYSLPNSYFDNPYSLRMLHSMQCITPTKSKGYCSTFQSCVPSLFTSDGELEAPALAELISFSIGFCTMDVSGGSNVLMKRNGNRFSAVANRIICCPGSPPASGVVSAEESSEKFNDFLAGKGPQVSSFDEDEHKQPLTSSLSPLTSHVNRKPISQQFPQSQASGQLHDHQVMQQQPADESVEDHSHDEPSIVSDETLSIPMSNGKPQLPLSQQGSSETAEISSSELGHPEGQNDQNDVKSSEEKVSTIPIEAFIPPDKFDTYDPQTNKFSDQLLTTLDGNNNGPIGASEGGSALTTGQDSSSLNSGDKMSGNNEPALEVNNVGSENIQNSESFTISDKLNSSATDKVDKVPFDNKSVNSTIIKISPEPVIGANGKFTLEKGVIVEKATSETPRPKPNPAFQTQIGETTVNIIKTETTIDSNPVLIMSQNNSNNSNKSPVQDAAEASDESLDADVVAVPNFSAKIPSVVDDEELEVAQSDEGHHEADDGMEDEHHLGSNDFVPTTTFKYQVNQEVQDAQKDTSGTDSDNSVPTTVQYFKGQDSEKFMNDEDETSGGQISVTTSRTADTDIVDTTLVPILPPAINGEGVTHLPTPTEGENEQTTTNKYIANNGENTDNDNNAADKEGVTAGTSLPPTSVAQDEPFSYTNQLDEKLAGDAVPEYSTTFASVQDSDVKTPLSDIQFTSHNFQVNKSSTSYPAQGVSLPTQNQEQQKTSDETFPGTSYEPNQFSPGKEPSSYELQSVDDSAEMPPHFSSIAGQKYRPSKPVSIFGGVQRPALSNPLFLGGAAKVTPQIHEDDSLEVEHNPPYPTSQSGWSIDQLYQDQSGKNNKTSLTLEIELTKPLSTDMKEESGIWSNKLQTINTDDKTVLLGSTQEMPASGSDDTSSESQSGSSESAEPSAEKDAPVEQSLNQFESGLLPHSQDVNPEINQEAPIKELSNSHAHKTNPTVDFTGSEETVLVQNDQSSDPETSSYPSVEEAQVYPTIAAPVSPKVPSEVSVSSEVPVTAAPSSPPETTQSPPSLPAIIVTPSNLKKPFMPGGSSEIGGLNPQELEAVGQPEYQILSSCATQDYYRSLEQDSLRQYPFLATIVGGSRPFCSGTLITDRHILTAAHFLSNITVSDVFHMRVHVGYRTAFGGQTEGPYAVRKVLKVIRHKGFNFDKLVNDIAILILDRPIRFSEDVHPVCLSNSPHLYSNGVTEAFETGWMEDPLMQKISPLHPFVDPHILKYFTFGYKNVTWTLQEAVTRIRTNDECQANYGFLERSGISITDSMVCAASNSESKSCSFKGNSGSPLFISNDGKPIQVGLVSWGIGCGHFPSVFTGVSSFLPWIEKVVYKTS